MADQRSARLTPVLAITIVVLGLATFDILQPRIGGPAYMPVFSASTLENAPLGPKTRFLAASHPSPANGIWAVTPGASSTEVKRWNRDTSRQFKPPVAFNLPTTKAMRPFAVSTWRSRAPALFLLSGANRRPTVHAIDIASGRPVFKPAKTGFLGRVPRRGARSYKIAKWSGSLPDLFIIQRDDEDPQWDIRVLSGESGFREEIYKTRTPEVISQRLIGKDFAIELAEVGSPRPDLILVTTGHPSGSRQTELHLLSGASGFQEFKIRIGTNLPGILPGRNDFIFLPSGRKTGPDGHRVPGVLVNVRHIDRQVKVFQLQVRY